MYKMRKFIDLDLLVIGMSFLLAFFIILFASKSNIEISYQLEDISNLYTQQSKQVLLDTIYLNSKFIPFYIIGNRIILNVPSYYYREEKIANNFKNYFGKNIYFYHYITYNCIYLIQQDLRERGYDIDVYQILYDLRDYIDSSFNYVKFNIVDEIPYYYIKIESPWNCYDYIQIYIK